MDLKLEVLRQEVKLFRKKSERVLTRLLALVELTKFRQKWGRASEQDYERIAAKFGASGRTLYRWEAAYKHGSAEALVPKKAPGRKPTAIRGHTAKRISEWRKLYNWGAEVIQAHLERDHDVKLTRHKINAFLRKKGLLVRRKSKPRKKHTRVVRVQHPGHHTQTDVKHLPHLLPDGVKCYVYNFVDHASKWSFKKAYDSYGAAETKDFMSCVIAAAPFSISRLQSDNGVEFTNKYVSHEDEPKTHALDELCASHEIRHVLIPPGEKELQGLVERSHRQDDDELYHRCKPRTLAEFNRELAGHCVWRNTRRRRKSLDWKTSDEWLADYRKNFEKWLYENGASPFQIQAAPERADESVVSVEKTA
jgi:transposase